MGQGVLDLLGATLPGMSDEELAELAGRVLIEQHKRADAAAKGATGTPSAPRISGSPRRSANVWLMHVKGLKNTTPKNMFDLEGKFIRPGAVRSLPEGAAVLAGWSNGGGKHYVLMRAAAGHSTGFRATLASGERFQLIPGAEFVVESHGHRLFEPIAAALSCWDWPEATDGASEEPTGTSVDWS